ncbi:LuxR C-terminal-related transcriptional regulator [Dietzia maris]
MKVRVSVVNDYSLVVAGVEALLGPYADRVHVVPTHHATDVATPVDVALFDTFGSGPGWQQRCAEMARDPQIGAVAVYSFITDPRAVDEALAAGARGFLAKSLIGDELVSGIERIAAGERVTVIDREDSGPAAPWPAGGVGLTPREAEMLALITQGRSNEEITVACYLSINTVKSYIRDAYRKIGVTTRPQAVAWALRNGLGSSH